MIGLVALIVIGPEKLPRVARTLGHLSGRLQRYVADVKADINRESMQQAAGDLEASVQSGLSRAETALNKSVQAAVKKNPAEEKREEAKSA